ncbi:MAG: hypothetical protein E6Z86_16635 [Clostridium butyricum]|nr:hypothetical protein [Clostridium butyricum]MDU5821656.1 hypothetical protein [Clostridium butyricum]
MSIINIFKLLLSLPIIVIFYKDGMHKINNIYKYYLIVTDFKVNKNNCFIKLLTSIFISCDLTIVLGLLFPSTRNISCIWGIVLEVFYITIMLKNYKKEFKNGCNCYIINATSEVELNDILKIIAIIFNFICILII